MKFGQMWTEIQNTSKRSKLMLGKCDLLQSAFLATR